MAKNLRIKAARAALDMTQKDLADAVGVSRQRMRLKKEIIIQQLNFVLKFVKF